MKAPIASSTIAQSENQLPTTDRRQFAADLRRISFLSIIWACGTIAILMRVFWQHRRVRRWMAAGEKIGRIASAGAVRSARTDSSQREESYHSELLSVARDALATMKIRTAIDIYLVSKLKVPALFGIFRPAILLPKELVESGDLARLRLVFLHEIAHLRRLDVLINWLAIFARALHWFNPLVWLALRRLRIDQELLCDRDVMRTLHPAEHRGYGEALLALASPRGFEFSTLIPVSSNFKQLKERIAMIKQFKPVTNRLLLFTLPPLAAVLAIITFTAATENSAPKPVELEKPVSESASKFLDPEIRKLENELARENSQVKTFEAVLNQLQSEDSTAERDRKIESVGKILSAEKQQTKILQERLDQWRKGAELLKQNSQSTDALRQERARKAMMQLEDQWHQLTDQVRAKEAQVDDLRKTLKIFPAETAQDVQLFSAESVRQIEQERIRAEHELLQYQRLLKDLKSKNRQEQIQAIPTAYRDEALDRLLQDLRSAEQRLVTLRIDYDIAHPDVQRATALIKEINRQIDERLAGVLDGLQAVVSSRRAVTEALQKELEEIKTAESQRLEQARPYFKAKQDLETQQKLRDSIYIRILQEKVDSGLAN